jgi:hypothetical protein
MDLGRWLTWGVGESTVEGMEAMVENTVKKGGPGLPKGYKKPCKQLWAMRAAVQKEAGGGREVEKLRELLQSDPRTFWAMKAKLEAAFQAQKGKGSEAGKPPPEPEKMDEGTARVLELLRELKGGGG